MLALGVLTKLRIKTMLMLSRKSLWTTRGLEMVPKTSTSLLKPQLMDQKSPIRTEGRKRISSLISTQKQKILRINPLTKNYRKLLTYLPNKCMLTMQLISNSRLQIWQRRQHPRKGKRLRMHKRLSKRQKRERRMKKVLRNWKLNWPRRKLKQLKQKLKLKKRQRRLLQGMPKRRDWRKKQLLLKLKGNAKRKKLQMQLRLKDYVWKRKHRMQPRKQ